MAEGGAGVRSMTGFGHADGETGGVSWRWELKSVNGRGLDIRCRLGSRFDRLEPDAKACIAARLRRGNVNVTLEVAQAVPEAAVRVNAVALQTILGAIADIQVRIETAPPRPEAILALRGVLEAGEDPSAAEPDEALTAAVLAGLDTAVADLDAARAREGAALDAVIAGLIDEIEGLASAAATAAAAQADAQRTRFLAQVRDLLAQAPDLSEERLHQEVTLLLVKADVREEIDRLLSHVAEARALMRQAGAIGRKLDFLTQEFNREANTLCSKAASTDLTRIGLDLKAAIDRLREQAQNVE
ncbi:YicC/YloC family endoribonuclease [Futiania mangrovi]|uniref:YicC family protein n=1 Tax=Futiania mangrovi TaxID=2959716 RepID=A0A9J6PBS1_9PROT|nr:YicC/YloC family endoribonuclease [Futiania mangrovii]MCP1335646.1 YicC family protein [Futiania mangrovii]